MPAGCILRLSYPANKNKKQGFLYFFSYDISRLAIQVFRTVSHSKQKLPKTFFFPHLQRVAFLREEDLLQAHKHSVDTHMFLAHCKRIQKNSGGVFHHRHAPSYLMTKMRLYRLEGFVTLPMQRVTWEIKLVLFCRSLACIYSKALTYSHAFLSLVYLFSLFKAYHTCFFYVFCLKKRKENHRHQSFLHSRRDNAISVGL